MIDIKTTNIICHLDLFPSLIYLTRWKQRPPHKSRVFKRRPVMPSPVMPSPGMSSTPTTAHQWHKLNSLLDEIIQIHTQSLGVRVGNTDREEIMASLKKLPAILTPVLQSYDKGNAMKYTSSAVKVDLYERFGPTFERLRTLSTSSQTWVAATEFLALFGLTHTFFDDILDALMVDLQSSKDNANQAGEKKLEPLFLILKHIVTDAKDSDLTLNLASFTEASFAENYKKVVAAFHKYNTRVQPALNLLHQLVLDSAGGDEKILAGCDTINLISKSLLKIKIEFPDS